MSGDTLYAFRGDGTFIGADGASSAAPVPFFVLGADPGRIHLSAGDMDLYVGREVLVASPLPGDPTRTRLAAISYVPGTGSMIRTQIVYDGRIAGTPTMADVDSLDKGLMELVAPVRTEAGGYLSVTLLGETLNDDQQYPATGYRFSLGDTVTFTDAVVGDLNRDGLDDIVVADSRGYVHALDMIVRTVDGSAKDRSKGTRGGNDLDYFAELPGWPVGIGTLAEDALSLGDVDGDGYLEVLLFGPGNRLHALNYNGTSILDLPGPVPAEEFYVPSYLSPLLADVAGGAGGGDELVLPLPDGQVRAVDRSDRRHLRWCYLGGGSQGLYPVLADLDGDGTLELVTTEDVTVSLPANNDQGDTDPGVVRRGRVLVREIGAANGGGAWPAYRHDAARSGRAPLPDSPAPATRSQPLLSEAFLMPNPVRDQGAGIHYLVRSDVQRVTIEVLDMTGAEVRTLDGSIDPGTDNVVRWDLANDRGHRVAPGYYVARLQAEAGTVVDVRMVRFVVLR